MWASAKFCSKGRQLPYALFNGLQTAVFHASAAHVLRVHCAAALKNSGFRLITLRVMLLPVFLISLSYIPDAFAEESQEQLLGRIEHYLSGLKTMKSRFKQTSPDGAYAYGTFYLERPGKMRWEYDDPTPILMLSNGDFLTYIDYELEQVSHIPMDSTMLSFLARDKVQFGDEMMVTDIRSGADAVRMTVMQRGKEDEGSITLVFNDSPLQLNKFWVLDALGQVTEVDLQSPTLNIALDDELFAFKEFRKSRSVRPY